MLLKNQEIELKQLQKLICSFVKRKDFQISSMHANFFGEHSRIFYQIEPFSDTFAYVWCFSHVEIILAFLFVYGLTFFTRQHAI